MSTFHERVIAACEAEGIDSTRLAKLSGVNQSTCYRILNGQSTPTLDTATKLSFVLAISLDGPDGPSDFLREGDARVLAEEAWSEFYNSVDPAFRQYMFRDQFVAGFMAGRES